jgi:hypothetical protein
MVKSKKGSRARPARAPSSGADADTRITAALERLAPAKSATPDFHVHAAAIGLGAIISFVGHRTFSFVRRRSPA